MGKIEILENRRLMSFALFGADTALPVTGDVTGIDVASAADGRYIVAAHVVNGDDNSIVAVRYAPSGGQLGDPVTVASYEHAPWSDASWPGWGDPSVSVSINDTGEAILAFQIPPEVADPYGIYTARISSEGVAGPPIMVSPPGTSAAHDLSQPEVSLDSAGGYFVGYLDFLYGSDEAIDSLHPFIRAFDADDNQLGDTISLGGSVAGNGSPGRAEIAARKYGSGAVIAVAHYQDLETSIDKVVFKDLTLPDMDEPEQTLHDQPWADSFFPPNPLGDDTDEPSIALNDDGSFVIGFRRSVTLETIEDPSVQAAYAQRFDASGQKVGEPINLATSLPGEGLRTGTHSVILAPAPDGGFFASFVQTLDGVATTFARHYDAAGTPDPSGPVAITNQPSDGPNGLGLNLPRAALSADATGRAALVYLDPGFGSHIRRLSSNVAEVDQSVLYLLGTSGDDRLDVAPDGANVIAASKAGSRTFAAADISAISIDGLAGDDKITNRTGLRSVLTGGEGRDSIYGGDNRDSLYGNGGNDRLFGGRGNDRLAGHGGRDRLFGEANSDRLYGGASGDWLYGQSGADQLFGDGGADRLYADDNDGAVDTVRGNAGDDLLVTRDALIDDVNGDAGRDTAFADADDLLSGIESAA